MADRRDKFLSDPADFVPDEAAEPTADPEVLQQAALDLREHYPDDDEFAAAMERLEALLAGEEGASPAEGAG